MPESIFVDAVEQVVAANQHWVPPPEKAPCVRPLLMGSGPVLGVAPAPSYTFLIVYLLARTSSGMVAIDLLISEHHHGLQAGGVKAIGITPGMKPNKAKHRAMQK